jgi:hypothetical protein
MSICAIDPGNEKSALIEWDGTKILDAHILGNNLMLNYLSSTPSNAKNLVIEMIASYGMAVGQTVFDTCVWIGRFMQFFPGKTVLVYRRDIKLHVCNSSKAKDSNIRQALIDRFEPTLQPRQRPKGVLKELSADLWQAFALAVYANDKRLFE